MSAWLAYGGAALLVAATVPQVVRLARTRSARDFSWGFIALNFVGITFLALRSGELREWGFLAANVSTAGFWLLAFAVKAWEAKVPAPRATSAAMAKPWRDGT